MFKKWIRNLVRWANSNSDSDVQLVCSDSYASKLEAEGLRFTIFKASGGKVVQFKTYDKNRDINIVSLYIINDNDSLGTELEHIITKESLSR